MPKINITQIAFAKLYPMLINKAVKKGRTWQEVDSVTSWLTGYTAEDIAKIEKTSMTYGDFFLNSPSFNPNSSLITGNICGVRVEEIEDPLMWKIRCLDKLIDELAKGRPLEKIMRI